MITVHAKHEPYDDGHLGMVVAEMRLAGPPTLRVALTPAGLFALEGSHRLAAAWFLGLEPRLVALPSEVADYAPERWAMIAARLPRYDFGHVLLLDMGGITTLR